MSIKEVRERMSELNEKIENNIPEEQKDEIHELLLNTQEQCQMMEQCIKDQIQVKDSLIDKLHKELEYYKQEQADRLTDQISKEIISIRSMMQKRIRSEAWQNMTREDLVREYQYVFEDLTDFLERQNIDPFETMAGDGFDGKKHHAAKFVVTDNEKLDKTIKESVSAGYTKGDKVIVSERVIVYQLK